MKWMTLKEVAAQHNISYHAILYRVNEKRLPLREAVARPYTPQKRGPDTIKQRVKVAGVSETTVRRCLARGMTLEEALVYKPQTGFRVRA